MNSSELIWRLRAEGGFNATPLIDSGGLVAGLHLTRFAQDGNVEVVQVWAEEWASFACIPDTLDPNAPLSVAPPEASRSGRLDEIAALLLKNDAHGARH